MIAKSLVFSSLLLVLGSVHAAPKQTDAVKIEPNQFSASRASIEDAIRKTDRYSELTGLQRRDLNAALDRMEATLQGVTSVDQLKDAQKVQLFNDQELINSVLTQAAEDSRLVCKREKRVGSNRSINKCLTVAERRRARDHAERETTMRTLSEKEVTMQYRPRGVK